MYFSTKYTNYEKVTNFSLIIFESNTKSLATIYIWIKNDFNKTACF